MSNDPPQPRIEESLELPVDELMRRARPLPPHAEIAIDDLTDEEAEAFFEAIRRRPAQRRPTQSS